MRKPRALAPGDRLAIVAPASPFTREEFDRGLDEIRRLGFEPVYDDSVFARQRYVAGPAQLRADAIHAAWRDASIAGVIGVRGGYGSAQVLPLLDRDEARRACKPFIGYSDLTSLLTFLTLGCGLVAFHGPMLAGRLGRGAEGTTPTPSSGRCAGANRWASWRRRGSKRFARARRRTAARRHADAAARVARHAVRVRAAGRLRAVPRRSRRAAVSPRSHGDAAPADGPAGARVGRRHRRAAEVRRAVGRSDRARRDGRPVRRLSPGRC